ncbi:MAG: hypothetical protein AAF957_04465 [Planctomycetota bacterium]
MAATVSALREAGRHRREWSERSPVAILLVTVEHEVFELAALAPTSAVGSRALRRLLDDAPLLELEDQDLVSRWQECVRAEILAYTNRPETWTEPAAERFSEDCSVVFGIDVDRVPALVQVFYGMTREERYGVFLYVERTSPFAFLTREIDEAEGKRAANPERAFRTLIRSTCEGS